MASSATQMSIVEYLEKSYTMIQRLTETNKIIALKNKELFAKIIGMQYEIKRLSNENRILKEKLIKKREIEEFEIV